VIAPARVTLKGSRDLRSWHATLKGSRYRQGRSTLRARYAWFPFVILPSPPTFHTCTALL
jgi:hypothetical protein